MTPGRNFKTPAWVKHIKGTSEMEKRRKPLSKWLARQYNRSLPARWMGGFPNIVPRCRWHLLLPIGSFDGVDGASECRTYNLFFKIVTIVGIWKTLLWNIVETVLTTELSIKHKWDPEEPLHMSLLCVRICRMSNRHFGPFKWSWKGIRCSHLLRDHAGVEYEQGSPTRRDLHGALLCSTAVNWMFLEWDSAQPTGWSSAEVLSVGTIFLKHYAVQEVN